MNDGSTNDMANETRGRGVRSIKIVSGGQTGVDRAALDAALVCGLAVGGWCPAGRRAEDGRIPSHYPLEETPSPEYEERTAWNVRDSDATLILCRGEPVGGTLLTLEEAARQGKPVMVIDPRQFRANDVIDWLREHDITRLNVAGARESEEPGVYGDVRKALLSLLERAAPKYKRE